MKNDFDVVVVGASLAGCTTAILLGRAGVRVALVESHKDAAAYKRPCTHFIQSSATPVFERLGLVEQIEAAGGVRNSVALWSQRGWVHPPGVNGNGNGARPHGYTIRRVKLDPMIRAAAAETENVELMLGATAREVEDEPGRPLTLSVDSGGERRRLHARLLVGADGRNSAVAKLTESPSRGLLNRRFMYYAYYQDVDLSFGDTGQLWFCEPDMGYTFPTDEGLTLMACSVRKERLAEFKADTDGSFERFFAQLPQGPRPDPAKRATPFVGKLDMTNRYRAATRGRVAFVGDAAIAPDPSWAVGCGWALRSGEWLADAVAGPLRDGGDLAPALRRYRKVHRRELGPAFAATSSYSVVRPMFPPERLLFRGAARDVELAEVLHGFGDGRVQLWSLFSPATLGRAAWVSARHPRSLEPA